MGKIRKYRNLVLILIDILIIFSAYFVTSFLTQSMSDFLANKNWVKDYQSKFNFEEFEDFESKDVLFYDEAKINTRLIELNKYAKAL